MHWWPIWLKFFFSFRKWSRALNAKCEQNFLTSICFCNFTCPKLLLVWFFNIKSDLTFMFIIGGYKKLTFRCNCCWWERTFPSGRLVFIIIYWRMIFITVVFCHIFIICSNGVIRWGFSVCIDFFLVFIILGGGHTNTYLALYYIQKYLQLSF